MSNKMDVAESDPVSPAMQALLGLFATDLKTVPFPDMDLSVLKAAADQVHARAEAVERAQAALEAARAELHQSQEHLLQKGQRALAYARVYAEEHPALAEKLEAISLPRPLRRPPGKEAEDAGSPPKRRGRPPKARPSASLFTEAGPSSQPEGAAQDAA
jgi:ElaB/YqjD/DUF883 family membrane-anchored ribosome-binding protein